MIHKSSFFSKKKNINPEEHTFLETSTRGCGAWYYNLPTSSVPSVPGATLSYYNGPWQGLQWWWTTSSLAGQLHNSLRLISAVQSPYHMCWCVANVLQIANSISSVVQLKIPEHRPGFPESVEQVNNASVTLDDLGNVSSDNVHGTIGCRSDAEASKKDKPIVSWILHCVDPEANSVPEAFSPHRIHHAHWIWWVCWKYMPCIVLKLHPCWIRRNIPGKWCVVIISRYSTEGREKIWNNLIDLLLRPCLFKWMII